MSTTVTITLDSPIKRGEQPITEITLRRPDSGALRGTALTDVLNMDVSALTTVLPRITTPALTQQDVKRMDPADLLAIGQEVTGFLLKKADLEQAKKEIGETNPAASIGIASTTTPTKAASA